MQRDIDTLGQWADSWQMQFNVSQCKTMHMGFKNSKQDYTMKGHKLDLMQLERDLGVSISSNMEVIEQCN